MCPISQHRFTDLGSYFPGPRRCFRLYYIEYTSSYQISGSRTSYRLPTCPSQLPHLLTVASCRGCLRSDVGDVTLPCTVLVAQKFSLPATALEGYTEPPRWLKSKDSNQSTASKQLGNLLSIGNEFHATFWNCQEEGKALFVYLSFETPTDSM